MVYLGVYTNPRFRGLGDKGGQFYKGIFFSIKKERSSNTRYDMEELKNGMLSEISQTQRTNTI